MSTTYYEVILFGEFYARDFKAISNRFTIISESARTMHTREIVFEPPDAHVQREQGNEPVLLRAKQELDGSDPGWVLFSYLKPEPARMHPEATVRPWATCQVVAGDALALASGLGYIQRTQVYKRGYIFRRGPLLIQMSQQESVNTSTGEPMAAHPDTPWQVEVKTASPVRNTQETPLSKYVDAVVEVQQLMKGLLDLWKQGV